MCYRCVRRGEMRSASAWMTDAISCRGQTMTLGEIVLVLVTRCIVRAGESSFCVFYYCGVTDVILGV